MCSGPRCGTMVQETKICPKCGGAMAIGCIPDFAHASRPQQSLWHPGKPEFGFFGAMKIEEENCTPVVTFRCSNCGFLELYAHEKFSGG